MSVVEIVAFIVAFCAAASRLLAVSKPFWGYLPKGVAAVLPSVVVLLPALAEKLGGATTTVGLVNALVVAAALAVPGLSSKSDKEVK